MRTQGNLTAEPVWSLPAHPVEGKMLERHVSNGVRGKASWGKEPSRAFGTV